MKQASYKPGLFWCRAIVFVGILVCLCISDSAGLRLLPLPASSSFLDVNLFPRVGGADVSRTPSPNSESNTYLKMVSGSQYRARDGHYQLQLATHAPEVSCQLQPSNLVGTSETDSPVIFKPAPLSTPKGRAPPRFT